MSPHADNRVECVYGLTPLQAGMLFDARLHPDSHAYRLQQLIDVHGALNLSAAADALVPLSARHQALRTAIVVPAASGTPRQVVLRDRRPAYAERDLSGLDPADADAAIEAARVADLAHGYDLKNDPLARLTVLKLAPDHTILMWSFDHIVVDGWSMPIVLADFLRYYTALAAGHPLDRVTAQAAAEAAATTSYSDYLNWCAAHPTDQDLDYWHELLAGYETPATFSDLGLGDPTTAAQSEAARADISPQTAEALAQFARTHHLTPASALTAAWGLVLAHQARTDDVVFGQVRSGRDIELDGLDRAVGMFINTVPVRLTVQPDQTLGDIFSAFARQQIATQPHGRTPLADIQHLTPLGADLVSTLVVVENYYVDPAATRSQEVGGLTFTVRPGREQTQYPIVMRTPGHDFVETLYDPRVYSAEEARLLAARTVRVLDQATTHPDLPCSELDLLLPGEREAVIGRFSQTPPPAPHPQTLAGTFTHFAAAQPDKPAVLFAERSVTYRQLDARTNQIARVLQAMGAGPEKIVAIIARRGIGQTAAQIAVAKSGAAYLPIDADYPQARQQYLLEDAKPVALICSDAVPNLDPADLGIPVLDLQKDRAIIETQDQGPLPETSGPENLAYVIYTSGTTGQPKGVMVEQRQIAAFCAAMQQNLQPYLKDDDVVDLFCRYVFDASFQELAIGVFGGRTQCLIPEELFDDETAFSDYLVAHGVTVAFYSPAYFRQITPPDTLRIITTGGAAADHDSVVRAKAHGLFHNCYGPTESTVQATEWHCGPGEVVPSRVPIGRSLPGGRSYVVDDAGRPCGVGMPGELWLGGDLVARGYLGKPELTAERFIPDPFNPTPIATIPDQPARVYRTGDLARWRPDGQLVFDGRIDDQVKIRGFRIEPAEVENQLRTIPGIGDAAIAVGDGPSLHAFYTSTTGLDPEQVRTHLAELVPNYEIPSTITPLRHMPLNPSGKIDKHALLGLRHTPHLAHTPPATPAEQQVLDIFRDALGAPDAGVTDDFFELGGDSLTAIRVTTKLHAAGLGATVREIFSWRTAREIAAHATRTTAEEPADTDEAPRAATEIAVPHPVTPPSATAVSAEALGATLAAADAYGRWLAGAQAVGALPMSPSNLVTGKLGVHASGGLVTLDGPFDPGRFADTWNRVLDQHRIFLSRLDTGTRRIILTGPAPLGASQLPIVHVASAAEAELVGATLLGPSNFFTDAPEDSEPPSHRLAVLVYPGGALVVLQASHFVYDAFSGDVLRSAIQGATLARPEPGPVPVPERTRPLEYADYLRFLERGPNASDAEAYAALRLGDFAQAAAARAGEPHAPRATRPEIVSAGADPLHETARLIGQRLLAETGGRPVPVLIVTPGRSFKDADFNDAVGEFADLMPAVLTPEEPDPFNAVAPAAAFARAHDLVCDALAYPGPTPETPPDARLPRTARVLRDAIDNPDVPILNLMIGDQGAAASTTPPELIRDDDAPATPTGQFLRVVNAAIAGGTVIVHHLPEVPTAQAAPAPVGAGRHRRH